MKSKEIFNALSLLEEEKGIPMQFMIDKISKAIVTACKNSYNGNENVIVNIDQKKNKFDVFLKKKVCKNVTDPGNDISLSEARKIDPNTAIDEEVPVKLDTKEFGRIAAQTARNIIRQGIRDGERDLMVQEIEGRKGQIATAIVEKIEPRNGAASIRIGKAETFLPKNEQLPNEKFKEGDHIKVYVVDVRETDRGPKAVLSRTHPEMIKKMFEAQVPEMEDKTVEITNVSREAGSRSKVAVLSHDENVDPIGACIGPRGSRINAIINEFCGEKIDIIEYNEDPVKFITAAISPAEVLNVEILSEETPACQVTVKDSQLSLAIGNKGQNARLAAKLTGWKIDIKPLSAIEDSSTGENDLIEEN